MPDSTADGTNQLISTQTRDDVLVVSFAVEEIREAQISNQIRDQVTSILDDSPIHNVAMDMGAVRFIGSIGILVLLAVHRRIKPQGGRLVLFNVAGPINDMLAACRLAPTDEESSAPFDVADSLESALDQFRG